MIIAVLFVAHVPLHGFEAACILFGSLLPDIDHKSSKLGRYNPLTYLHWTKHRGRCHSIIGSFLLSAPFFLVSGLHGLLFVFYGALGHLCADKLYSFGKRKEPFAIRIW